MVGVILVVIKHLFESIEIEAISNVFLIDLTEKLMIFEITEPTDPSVTFFGTV